jgi:hypothetical protein
MMSLKPEHVFEVFEIDWYRNIDLRELEWVGEENYRTASQYSDYVHLLFPDKICAILTCSED